MLLLLGTCRQVLATRVADPLASYPRIAFIGIALIIAAMVWLTGCTQRGDLVGGRCPVKNLTLPPNAVYNKLPKGICPSDKDKHGTRSTFHEQTDFYAYYAIGFDHPEGFDAVRRYYDGEAESLGFEESFDTSKLSTYRGGCPGGVGRILIYISQDELSGICIQQTRKFATGEEHPIGEFLLTVLTHVATERGYRPTGGMDY